MFFRRNRPEPDAVEVTLGVRASFAGTLRSETSIKIDGSVAGGLIETPANVLITANARVVCEIAAHVVSISGSFEGAIRADRVEMLAGSQVAGLIHTGSFYREEGAVLLAEVRMRDGTRIPAATLPVSSHDSRPNPSMSAPGQIPGQNPGQNPGQIPGQPPRQAAAQPNVPPRTQGI
jgi:cytoskeletal protein CcmA (bactofilin family)